MSRTLLWLVALLALASLSSPADGAPMYVLSAPNLFRVGTTENIFVECQDCTTTGDIRVEIMVYNHPTKSTLLKNEFVILNSANGFQAFGKLTVAPGDFNRDPSAKRYVYLQARFPDQTLEKIVLVSFQSGYIFIQTDKTLYTPNTKVHYRIFALTPSMQPIERDDRDEDYSTVAIEIVVLYFIFDEHGTECNMICKWDHRGLSRPFSYNPGIWKVVAKFQNNPQESFAAEFEVKEYVLPSFEVKLLSLSPFFYVDSEQLTINIKATYLFGEEVDGMAFAVFGVMQQKDKTSFSSSLQRVPITRGSGKVILKREHITQAFPNIHDLVGTSIFVAVTVLTESGSDIVEAQLRNIQIVTSPYTIHFKKTPKYFKPGMTFDVAVEVLNPDESPAHGIDVVVEPGPVTGRTGDNGMAMLTMNLVATKDPLTITAKTANPLITATRQASATMTAIPHSTKRDNYIHIGVDTADISLGKNLKITFFLDSQTHTDITYLILSRGQLVNHARYKTQGQAIISQMITITKGMLPSFRIIAFYHTTDEVVSDSVWVDVRDSCMGMLKLESSRYYRSYQPRRMFGLKVTGDPGATVGLVAVDKGVYVLNNKHRLTQKKIWDAVEKYDTGCTPGGGKDSMSVFYDAGLLFASSIGFGTAYRQEFKCPAPKRKKRASTISDVTNTLASQYKDQQQRDCCRDGMMTIPLSYDCERRSEYIEIGAACVEAFLHCCKAIENQRAESKHDSLILARSEEEDFNEYSDDISTRTQFPESWMWSDIPLPNCPTERPDCESTSIVRTFPLQDSITTWQFTGISLSKTHGICVGDPLEVIVRKDFFIDLRMPYSTVRGEQVEVRAILHNYSPDPITVRVDLIEDENLCSLASKRKRFRQFVDIGNQTTKSVPFVIIPMKEGEYPIEVLGSVKDSSLTDGIMKKLRVVPAGVLVKSQHIVTLDPIKKGVEGKQSEILNSAIPEKDRAPKTPTSTQISLTGREHLSSLVENAISGNSMGTLIIQPSGCGEQNMMSMTLPVIATMYLDKTNQWEAVGLKRRYEALQHIKTGYQNQLRYRKPDGSFAVYPGSPSSTWLTAYVAKVFAMASSLAEVQNDVLCGAIQFLIIKAQQPNGMFVEVGKVYSSSMSGDVRGQDSDASMTAFCLIAMQESRQICTILSDSIEKSVTYLESRLHSLTYPYAVAMTSYALANAKKMDRDVLYKFISPALNHWPVPSNVYTLEATAYALLALVRTKLFEDARPVVRWFSQQRKVGGGYGSTQSTIMVYQAVAEYWASAKEPEYNVSVDLMLPGKSKPLSYNFNRNNHYATRTSKMNDFNQNVTVTAIGFGEATLTMVTYYYALPKEETSDCQKFNLSVQLIPEKMDDEEHVYKLKIEVLFKDKDFDAKMSILDIGLLTGFNPNTHDLDLLAKGSARIISKYEMNTALSEKGSLIIYLDKVSHIRPDEITFRIHQKMKVGLLQPAAVSVYEYYDQKHCVKFYHPKRTAGHLLRLCRNEECTCAEENCSMQKKDKVSNDERTNMVCETSPISKIDYVYKVRLEEFIEGLSTDIYTMKILTIIKEGTYDKSSLSNLRPFLSYPHCRQSLSLVKGKTYLIMGTSKDIRKDEDINSYQYILGERTWIEYWPTKTECQSDMRPTCMGLEEMEQQYTIFGCQGK
uniref:Complement component c3a, duplicate 5 n=1 Tax=Mola mola TaxID=94237 RepID=A0A3Q4C054_MOLML